MNQFNTTLHRLLEVKWHLLLLWSNGTSLLTSSHWPG